MRRGQQAILWKGEVVITVPTARFIRIALSLAALVAVVMMIAGCGDFIVYDAIEGQGVGGGPLAISPISAVVPVDGRMKFFALGGVSPYTFAIVTGSGTIDSGSGDYTAPGTAGVDEISLTDGDGTTVAAQTIIVD